MSTNGKRVRRSFTEEFKRDAVSLVVKEGYSFAKAAQAVNVSINSLRLWHQKYAPKPEPCGSDASVEELQAENRRLRRELASRIRIAFEADLRRREPPANRKPSTAHAIDKGLVVHRVLIRHMVNLAKQ